MNNSPRILVIEDDQDIANLLIMNLKDLHYQLDHCDHGARGLVMASSGDYDLIILDIMLPAMDGLEICRRLRSDKSVVPILMLTARDSEADRVVGLEMGADDYLTKPFSVRELQARVKAMLRRVEMLTQVSEQKTDSLTFDNLVIHEAKRQVKLNDKSVELTSTEFDLLIYMARQPGLVQRSRETARRARWPTATGR